MKQLIASALVMALGLLGAAHVPPAMGQATTFTESVRIPIEFVEPNPCAGEGVAITGDLHFLFHITVDPNAGTHVEVHFNPQGVMGTGLVTGATYQGTGATHDSVNINGPPPSEFTSVNNFLLIGRGPNNNLLVHSTTHVTINANGKVTAVVENARVECR